MILFYVSIESNKVVLVISYSSMKVNRHESKLTTYSIWKWLSINLKRFKKCLNQISVCNVITKSLNKSKQTQTIDTKQIVLLAVSFLFVKSFNSFDEFCYRLLQSLFILVCSLKSSCTLFPICCFFYNISSTPTLSIYIQQSFGLMQKKKRKTETRFQPVWVSFLRLLTWWCRLDKRSKLQYSYWIPLIVPLKA